MAGILEILKAMLGAALFVVGFFAVIFFFALLIVASF